MRIRPLLSGVAAAAALLAVATPTATAAPAHPGGVVVAHVPRGYYDLEAGLGSVWAMRNDEARYSTIYRIDPATNRITSTISLGFPAAFLAFGFGSVWVTDYYGSRVLRYSPAGVLQAQIRVGLQPQYLLVAFGSVWTSNHHGHSLTRVDPAGDRVVDTVQVGAHQFRDGPQEIVSNGHDLYVGSSNLTYLQRVDPDTDTVTDLADTGQGCCGDLQYAGGVIWDVGGTSVSDYDLAGHLHPRVPADSGDHLTTCAVLDGVLWYGENTPGAPGRLRAIDDRTGARVTDVALDGRAGSITAGFGSVWNLDWSSGALIRLTPAAS